jgi:translocation and assembly module TamB
LRIRGLSRAGLVLASKPIDVGLAAAINGGNAAMRAVAVSGGQVIGRAQARFSPIGPGPLLAELFDAPLFAQLRYAGPADTLWRLTDSEVFDLTGGVAIGADIRGRLVDPIIRGSVRSQNARLESAVTGTVIENLVADGQFNGSRLIFSRLGGKTTGGGAVEGSGSVSFAGGAPALDLTFNAQNALLLNRDDLAARVTGPLKIRSTGDGGPARGGVRIFDARQCLTRPD